MNKRISMGLALAMSFIIATVTFTLTMVFSMNHFNGLMENVKQREKSYQKLAEVDQKVRQNHLNGNKLDEQALTDSIVSGYLYGTGDEYARYYNAEEYVALLNSNAGEIVGFGVDVTKDPSGYIKITDVYDKSPAEAQGLKIGDLIKTIEGQDVLELGYTEAVNLLKGDPNTSVRLAIQRDSEVLEKSVTRKNLTIQTVKGEVVDNVGYIRIKEFNEKTPSQLKEKMEELRKQGIVGFVFDVRSNGGGLLSSVTDILGQLLPEGPIAYSVDRDGNKKEIAHSDGPGLDLPAMVLINNSTASAAELFASALADYNKASTVGNTSYGKGVMQNTISLSDGSAIRFTIAEYTPPISPNYNGVGITPEFEVKQNAEQVQKMFVQPIGEDEQFKKAVEVLKTKA